jgi:TetR/AcrR family transcriptional repressor of nem operon
MGRTSDAKERLMTAALKLVWEESYGAVTIDDICKCADVKKGSFYYFFNSKAELAVAAIERMWEQDWKPNLDRRFSSSVDPLQRITDYLASFYASQSEAKARTGKVLGCPMCSVGSEVSTHEDERAVSTTIRGIFERKRKYYESTIRDAMAAGDIEPCDPAKMAQALFGLIEGITTQSRIMNDPEIVRELPAMALGLLRVKDSSRLSRAKLPSLTAPAEEAAVAS